MAETTTKTATETATVSAKPVGKKPVAVKVSAAAAKPVPKKPAAKADATVKLAAKKPAAAKTTTAKPAAKNHSEALVINDAQRYRMIAEAAYYRAESNYFKSDSVRDWIEAEADIAALLSGTK